jgi:hypothetical protein
MKQHAIGCESTQISVDDGQLRISCTAGVRRELGDQFKVSCTGKSPWSTKAFVLTVRQIEHHDVVSSGIVIDQSRDTRPREWIKQALQSVEEAMESYMFQVIPGSHCRISN